MWPPLMKFLIAPDSTALMPTIVKHTHMKTNIQSMIAIPQSNGKYFSHVSLSLSVRLFFLRRSCFGFFGVKLVSTPVTNSCNK